MLCPSPWESDQRAVLCVKNWEVFRVGVLGVVLVCRSDFVCASVFGWVSCAGVGGEVDGVRALVLRPDRERNVWPV